MKSLMLLLSAAAVAAAPAPVFAAQPAALPDSVKHDVQCFMLYAMAVQHAVEGNNEKVKQAGGLGVMYFFTKLKVEAPNLDLFETIKQEADGMKGGAQLEATGRSCDTEFQQQGLLHHIHLHVQPNFAKLLGNVIRHVGVYGDCKKFYGCNGCCKTGFFKQLSCFLRIVGIASYFS